MKRLIFALILVSVKASASNHDYKPIIQDNNPIVQGNKPIVQENKPIIQHSKPIVRDYNPVVQENNPIVQDNKPIVRDYSPIVQENKPIVQENKPIVRDYTPIVQEKKPIVQENKPIVRDYKPIVQVTNPIIRNSIPSRDPAPGVSLKNADGYVTISKPEGVDNLSTSVFIDNTLAAKSDGAGVMKVVQTYGLPGRVLPVGKIYPQHYVNNNNMVIKGAGNVVSMGGPQISYSSSLYPYYPFHHRDAPPPHSFYPGSDYPYTPNFY